MSGGTDEEQAEQSRSVSSFTSVDVDDVDESKIELRKVECAKCKQEQQEEKLNHRTWIVSNTCGHYYHRECYKTEWDNCKKNNKKMFCSDQQCQKAIHSKSSVLSSLGHIFTCKVCGVPLRNEKDFKELNKSRELEECETIASIKELHQLMQLCYLSIYDCHAVTCDGGVRTLESFLELDINMLREFGLTFEGLLQHKKLRHLHQQTSSSLSVITQGCRTAGSATQHTATIAALHAHNAILRGAMIGSFGGSLSWVGGAVGVSIQIGFLFRDYWKGEITFKQFRTAVGIVTISSAFGVAAGVGGTVGGAMLGTMVFPGIGTIIGGILGGFLAGLAVSMGLQYGAERALEKWTVLSEEEKAEHDKLEAENAYKRACAVLGVKHTSKPSEVLRKRNEMALKYHPDKLPSLRRNDTKYIEECQELFVKVMTSYEIIKHRRTLVDTWKE